MRQDRHYDPKLRHLNVAGFSENRQGVMMSGRTWEREVLAIVYVKAITSAFPKISSTVACTSFVERNLEALRGLVDRKLRVGESTEFYASGGWPDVAVFVEIKKADVSQAKRWLMP